jgi:hypothetical protein
LRTIIRLSIFVAAVGLAACSTSPAVYRAATFYDQPPVAEHRLSRGARVEFSAPTLYLAQHLPSRVLLFDPLKDDKPKGEITDGVESPTGLATDRKGNLYVLNTDLAGIAIYSPGATKPTRTITQGVGYDSWGIAVDSTGNIFISEGVSRLVLGYHAGADVPFETIDFQSEPLGLAVNNEDALIVCAGSDVFKIPRETNKVVDLGLEGLTMTGGVSVRSDDALYVTDIAKNTVFVYLDGKRAPSFSFDSGMDGPTFSTFAIGDRFYQVNQETPTVEGFLRNHRRPFTTMGGLDFIYGAAAYPRF